MSMRTILLVSLFSLAACALPASAADLTDGYYWWDDPQDTGVSGAPQEANTLTVWTSFGWNMGDSTGGNRWDYAINVNSYTFVDSTGGATHSYYGAFTGSGTITLLGGGTAGATRLRGSAYNTFNGTWELRDDSILRLEKTNGRAISGGIIDVYSGTVSLRAENQFYNAPGLVFMGTGTDVLETRGYSGTLSTFTLSQSGTIDLGSGASVLQFGDCSGVTWDTATKILTVTNWSGNVTGGGTDQLFFGSSGTGLTTNQVDAIRFVDPAGFAPGTYSASIRSSGEVVPLLNSLTDRTWAVDGDGNWGGPSSNWGGNVPNDSTERADFLSAITAPRTVTVDATVTVGGMKFDNANGYTIAGSNAITLDGTTPTIQVLSGSHVIATPLILASSGVASVAGGQLTISGGIQGADMTLSKEGAGTLILGGTNSFDGGLLVNGGTVELAGGSALADTGAVAVASGATLDVNGTSEIIDCLTSTGNVNLNGGTLTLSGNHASNISGLTGTGTLVKNGAAEMDLGANSSYHGNMTIGACTVQLNGSEPFGTGTVTLNGTYVKALKNSSADFHITDSSTLECWGGAPVLSGGIVVEEGKTLTVSTSGGNPTYLNGVVSGAGDLKFIGGGTVLGGSASNTLAGTATLLADQSAGDPVRLAKTGGSIAIAGNVAIENNRTLQLDAGEQIVDGATLTLTGTGKFVLNNFTESITGLVMESSYDTSHTYYTGTIIDTGTIGILKTYSFTWGGVPYGNGRYYASTVNPFVTGNGYIEVVTPTESTWTSDDNGNWTVGARWAPGAPSGSTVTAKFLNAITAPRTVTVDAPVTINKIVFDNANKYTIAGTDAIILDGTTPTIQVVNGTHEISCPLASPLAGSSGLTKSGAGKLILSEPLTAVTSAVTVSEGILAIASNTGTSVVDSLTIGGSNDSWTGKLDLGNNAIVIKSGSEAVVINQIASALYGPSLWTGNGITASAAAAAPDTKEVGVLTNGTPGSPYFTEFGTATGLTGGEVLVRLTWAGDTDLSGVVDGDDLVMFIDGYYGVGTGWLYGDFDYSGTIDADDLAMFVNGYYAQGGTLGEVSTAEVPEPATLALLGLGGLGMLRRRTRTLSPSPFASRKSPLLKSSRKH